MTWIYVAECLYRKCGGGTIYIRTQINGRRTLRSTQTIKPAKAKKVLQRLRDETWFERYGEILPGFQVRSRKLTVKGIIATYIKAGCPTKKARKKAFDTVKKETSLCKPLQQWWGNKNPSGLTLADCDAYLEWRASGGFVSHFKVRGHEQERVTRGGNRIVDMELQTLINAINWAIRRGLLKANPLTGRGRYVGAEDVRHCREVAPDPKSLAQLEDFFRENGEDDIADCVLFIAYTGLRISEALARRWSEVKGEEEIIDCKRKKRGIFPWVIITPELKTLLADMERRREVSGGADDLMFPSPFDPSVSRDPSAIRNRLTRACKSLGVRHVTPHGLRSFFVTSARECGVTDSEISMLIGDKSGPALIASTYGDVRPEHLVRQAQRIRFRNDDVVKSTK